MPVERREDRIGVRLLLAAAILHRRAAVDRPEVACLEILVKIIEARGQIEIADLRGIARFVAELLLPVPGILVEEGPWCAIDVQRRIEEEFSIGGQVRQRAGADLDIEFDRRLIPLLVGVAAIILDDVEALAAEQRVALRRRDRKSVVWGKSVSVRLDLGGRRIIKTKNTENTTQLE